MKWRLRTWTIFAATAKPTEKGNRPISSFCPYIHGIGAAASSWSRCAKTVGSSCCPCHAATGPQTAVFPTSYLLPGRGFHDSPKAPWSAHRQPWGQGAALLSIDSGRAERSLAPKYWKGRSYAVPFRCCPRLHGITFHCNTTLIILCLASSLLPFLRRPDMPRPASHAHCSFRHTSSW